MLPLRAFGGSRAERFPAEAARRATRLDGATLDRVAEVHRVSLAPSLVRP